MAASIEKIVAVLPGFAAETDLEAGYPGPAHVAGSRRTKTFGMQSMGQYNPHCGPFLTCIRVISILGFEGIWVGNRRFWDLASSERMLGRSRSLILAPFQWCKDLGKEVGGWDRNVQPPSWWFKLVWRSGWFPISALPGVQTVKPANPNLILG